MKKQNLIDLIEKYLKALEGDEFEGLTAMIYLKDQYTVIEIHEEMQ